MGNEAETHTGPRVVNVFLAPRFEGRDERRQNLVHVAHDPEIRDLEDRRDGVLVDGHDVLLTLHADHVLGRTRDTARDVDHRLHGLTGLADLVRIGNPPGVDDGTRCARRAVQ